MGHRSTNLPLCRQNQGQNQDERVKGTQGRGHHAGAGQGTQLSWGHQGLAAENPSQGGKDVLGGEITGMQRL